MNVLFIQPFLIDFIHPCKIDSNLQDMIIWPVYLENFLKNKIPNLNSDLLFLPSRKSLQDFAMIFPVHLQRKSF